MPPIWKSGPTTLETRKPALRRARALARAVSRSRKSIGETAGRTPSWHSATYSIVYHPHRCKETDPAPSTAGCTSHTLPSAFPFADGAGIGMLLHLSKSFIGRSNREHEPLDANLLYRLCLHPRSLGALAPGFGSKRHGDRYQSLLELDEAMRAIAESAAARPEVMPTPTSSRTPQCSTAESVDCASLWRFAADVGSGASMKLHSPYAASVTQR